MWYWKDGNSYSQDNIDKSNAAVAEEMVPTPDIQGRSSDVFGDPSTDSVSSWNANEMIIIISTLEPTKIWMNLKW